MGQKVSITSLVSWRHAGEEGAIAIFRKRVGVIFALQVAALAALVFSIFPQLTWVVVAIAVLALSTTLANGRRAIIFTETEVRYRPPLGSTRPVLISEIRGLTRSCVLIPYLIRSVLRPGVSITLANGATEVWPLDIEQPEEVLRRLSVVARKAVH